MVNYWLNNWCTFTNQVPSKPLLLLVRHSWSYYQFSHLVKDGQVTQFLRQTIEWVASVQDLWGPIWSSGRIEGNVSDSKIALIKWPMQQLPVFWRSVLIFLKVLFIYF